MGYETCVFVSKWESEVVEHYNDPVEAGKGHVRHVLQLTMAGRMKYFFRGL